MKLASSLPLRLMLGAAVALVAVLALIVTLIGAASNQVLTQRTLAALEDQLIDASSIYRDGGIDALILHLDRRANAALTPRAGLSFGDGTARGRVSASDVANALDGGASNIYTYKDQITGHLVAARRGQIRLADGRAATLFFAHDIDDQSRLARTIQAIAASGLTVVALGALGFGLYARRRLLARVDTVTTTSRAIMAGDLSQRVARDASGDEIDQMAETLNAMLARIEELMQALRDVSDNIAHDLRTPLNRLRLIAEDALHAQLTPAPTQESLGRIIEEADGLITTFNNMLLITRLEHGVGAETFELVDVGQLVEDTAELYRPLAEDAQLVVHIDARAAGGAGTTAPANRQLLSQAIANLIDNAIKYTPPNRQRAPADVIVALRTTATALEISVADSGPGIAPEDRERALKRFVRLEKSRSLPGTGLGLSLVAAVARLHQGAIRLEDNAPGLKAVLVLPVGHAP